MKSAPSRNRSGLVFAAIIAAVSSGCGYRFAAAGSGLPSSAETIYVAQFKNKSRVTGLNDEFARYLKDEIASHKRLQIVDDPSKADLALGGTIASDEQTPTTFNSVVEPTQYNEQVIIDAVLRDNHNNKIIWSVHRMAANDFYAVVPESVVATSPEFLQGNLRSRDISRLPDIQLAKSQRASSRDQIMSEIAHNLYAAMSEGF